MVTFSISIIFKVKSNFEPNVLKWVMKTNFINSNPFALVIINVKILSNFQKEWCTFGKKKWCLKKKTIHSQSLSALNMQKNFWFVSNYCVQKNLWQSKLLYFPCDLSNTQKCSFKECPFTWVIPLIMILRFKLILYLDIKVH